MEKKERRAQNKVVRDAESNSPAPDFDTPRGRKNKKGKAKTVDIEVATPVNGKRKRAAGGKSTSMTPSLIEEDDDERDTVSSLHFHGRCTKFDAYDF